MIRITLKTVGICAVFFLITLVNGCALLNAGTQTSGADAVMQLGEYHGLKHAIGCKDFQNQAGWSGRWRIGNNVSIMLESALYDTGRFVLVEREKLRDVMMEQDLVASGRTAKAKKVAKMGLIRPARYIATGAVTDVSENTSGGLGAISYKGISLGGGKSKATITIIAKLIDTTTGEIVAKKRIIGKAGRSSFKVGLSRGGLRTSMGGFKKTPLGEACQDCMNHAAVFFATAMEEIPFEGSVVKVSRGKVIINRGSEYGMTVGKTLVMRQEGELLTDPDTGAILGKEEGELIGKLEITKTLEKMSYCKVLSGEKKPSPGTVVIEE